MNAAARLGAFGLILSLALAGGAAVGATFGPDPDDGPPPADELSVESHADGHGR